VLTTELVLTPEQKAFRSRTGLDGGPTLQRDKYHQLLAQLVGTGVEVVAREFAEWQEKYAFRRGERVTWLSFYYNGKGAFTRVLETGGKPVDKELSAWLRERFDRPVHYVLREDGEGSGEEAAVGESFDDAATEVQFGEGQEHLEAFHDDFAERLAFSGIRITGVTHEEWRERYELRRGAECATVVFHHDSTNRMTAGWPLEKGCNSQSLLDRVEEVIGDIIKV
jgi:hypothetical protein